MNEAVRLRLSVEEAVDRIAADIADYLDGGPDREVENIELGMGLGLKIEGIRSRWASAREQKATIEAVRPTETELKASDSIQTPGREERSAGAEEPASEGEPIVVAELAPAEPYAASASSCPVEQSGVDEETYIEDSEDPANNIRRKLWRIAEALQVIEPSPEMIEKVGSVLWRMSEGDRDAGCAYFVKWLRARRVSDEEARRLWSGGFVRWCGVEELYRIAQSKGWRYPIAQNLNRLDQMVQRVEAALVRAGTEIYQTGGRLVRPATVEVDATKGRKTRIARLVPIEPAFLKAELTHFVDFFSWKKETKSPIAPPNEVVNTLLGRYGKWDFPTITGVICAPTLRRNGSVLVEEGFDPSTGLLVLGPLPEMPPLIAKPSRGDAETAIRLLDGLLDEFPFVDQASRGVALSGFLSTVCRPALGCVPLHATSAPAAGTGKSFLLDVIAAVAIGDAMPAIAAGADLTEMAKRIDAQVIAGFTMLSIDNVSMPIGGDELCQVIERPSYTPRILGQSKMKEQRNN